MARYSNRTDIKIKKQKPPSGPGWEGMKLVDEYIVPHSIFDAATSFGYAKVGKIGARAVSGIAKKGAKHVAKAFRNIG